MSNSSRKPLKQINKHRLTALIILLNIIFDFAIYHFIGNNDWALGLCVIINKLSASWVVKQYYVSNYYTCLFGYNLWFPIYFRFIFGFLLIALVVLIVQFNLTATIIEGSDGDDVINGTENNDFIRGFAGNNTIYGGADNDVIYGGNGNDIIQGGTGNDILRGGNGNDTYIFNLGDGFDVIEEYEKSYGGDHNQIVFGEGITLSDLRFVVDLNSDNPSSLFIRFNNSPTDQIEIKNFSFFPNLSSFNTKKINNGNRSYLVC